MFFFPLAVLMMSFLALCLLTSFLQLYPTQCLSFLINIIFSFRFLWTLYVSVVSCSLHLPCMEIRNVLKCIYIQGFHAFIGLSFFLGTWCLRKDRRELLQIWHPLKLIIEMIWLCWWNVTIMSQNMCLDRTSEFICWFWQSLHTRLIG